MKSVKTLIIGAGQSGLATSYCLKELGEEHLILERTEKPAHVWSDQRWDSFTLVTPNWTVNLPGAKYEGTDTEGFMPLNDVVDYFDRYARSFDAPIQYNTTVETVEPANSDGFRVRTAEETIHAENVVMATGFEQDPHIPAVAANLSPEITQLHSSSYKNPQSIPDGGVLVVGSGQSGVQIAEELNDAGRNVFLSVSSIGRVPRRYRGKEIVKWLAEIGFFDLTAETAPFPPEKFHPPQISGKNGGHTINLHQFARDGMTLLGRVQSADNSTVTLAADLQENLARVDGFEKQILQMIDGYIAARGLDIPPEALPELKDGYQQPVKEKIDLRAEGVNTVIWATGFTHGLNIVQMPIADERGLLVQDHGVSPIQGLYFVGMPWSPTPKSILIVGAGETARGVAAHISKRQTSSNSNQPLLTTAS